MMPFGDPPPVLPPSGGAADETGRAAGGVSAVVPEIEAVPGGEGGRVGSRSSMRCRYWYGGYQTTSRTPPQPWRFRPQRAAGGPSGTWIRCPGAAWSIPNASRRTPSELQK